MNSKDITLSASLMGLYVAIQIISAVSPIKIRGLMFSALFGLFWHLFSIKQNLAFQTGRYFWNMIIFVRIAPKIINTVTLQLIAGLSFLDWVNETTGMIVNTEGHDLLMIMGQVNLTILFWSIHVLYSGLFCFILPYLFYKYFKFIGIYKRLPIF